MEASHNEETDYRVTAIVVGMSVGSAIMVITESEALGPTIVHIILIFQWLLAAVAIAKATYLIVKYSREASRQKLIEDLIEPTADENEQA